LSTMYRDDEDAVQATFCIVKNNAEGAIMQQHPNRPITSWLQWLAQNLSRYAKG
jgi:hypothetical protein